MSNLNLHKAKKVKNDEFYTMYQNIEKELTHYLPHFKGKTVYLNCDNPILSQFWAYFSTNFQKLELQELIATHYINQNPTLFDTKPIPKPYLYRQTPKGIKKEFLMDDGDFRSKECKDILAKSDIVVTNPPFSLFREYIAQLIKYDKKFLIIGNQNAISYKEIFPLLKENKVWLGHTYGRMMFHISNHNYRLSAKTQTFGNICWFTNLETNKRNESLPLFKLYNENDYPKYDNYDAINVDWVDEIPIDYDGYMGVPITFMQKHNPNQFEIIGQGQGNLYRELTSKGLSQKFVDDYYKTGGTGSIKEDHPVLGYYDKKGKAVIPYMRIIISKINQNGEIGRHARLKIL